MMRAAAVLFALVSVAALLASAGVVGPEALELRNRGIGELENEQPASAEPIFKELAEKVPGDPLPWANLAIAALRQQRFEDAEAWLDKADAIDPGSPSLAAIRGEILQWSGRSGQALVELRKAAHGAPDDAEIQYALYRLAETLDGDEAKAAGDEALDRLARLRPDNLVVIMQQALRARERGDRAAASSHFLRVRELSWQAPGAAEQLLTQVLDALAAGDLDAARVPSLRLDNVLKITPMHRESLRELSQGIQGIPIYRFRGEAAPTEWGQGAKVTYRGSAVSDVPTVGRALAVADLDGDERPEIARLIGGGGGETRVEVRRAATKWREAVVAPAPGVEGLLAADLDNDGRIDLIGYGPRGTRLWTSDDGGKLSERAAELGLASAGGRAGAVIDYDIEGDLDLALAGGGADPELLRNALNGPLEAVGGRVFPDLGLAAASDLVASDLDRDGDLDLLVAHDGGLAWLDNLRQGQFGDRTETGGLGAAKQARAVVSADLDDDGRPDIAAAGDGLHLYRNAGGAFEAWSLGNLRGTTRFTAVEALDADNDGRLDLAVAGPAAIAVLARSAAGFKFLALEGAPAGAEALAVADLDGDGDLDLVTAGAGGLHRLDNDGGNQNRWLAIRLRGLDQGSGKNNLFGLGASLELHSGSAYQFREAQGEVTHFGLGSQPAADVLRVVWTNGVPQNRFDLEAKQTIVETQVLKGSCPFLYAWDGAEMSFVTDLLWGSPAGLPIGPGMWAPADPAELVKIPGIAAQDGEVRLRVTEELWEAAFFDQVRLWVVDHPEEVEVASALKIVPGSPTPERVLGTRELRPVAAAWDARGDLVTERVGRRDDVYADGWERSRYQGIAARPWQLTFDLGEAPAAPVRLHLDGWIFPSDASLNLAVAQRGGPPPIAARLEVESGGGWQVLVEQMGFPAGKTKTMVVDTPPLPTGARKLRIVSTQWLSWDRIAWSTAPADSEPRVVARKTAALADLRFRGFSALVRKAPNAPHEYDYANLSTESPWLPFPGPYTRFGDVRELLAEADDRSVILGPGDEIDLAFDVSELAPPAPGWTRTLFLESHGWDKDADRNTWEGHQVEPLPFRAMSGYPFAAGESFPDTPEMRDYRREWLTRIVEPERPGR